MTQIPRPQWLSGVPVVPESAPAPVEPPAGQQAVNSKAFVSDALHNRVALAVRRHAGLFLGFSGSLADMLLADTELLDALVTYRTAQRLAEHAPGTDLQTRFRLASASARKSEHHWPADCLAEAADVLDGVQDRLKALQILAHAWATQATDYDEDTERQIEDGWTLLALLEDPVPQTRDVPAMEERGREAMTEWRESGSQLPEEEPDA